VQRTSGLPSLLAPAITRGVSSATLGTHIASWPERPVTLEPWHAEWALLTAACCHSSPDPTHGRSGATLTVKDACTAAMLAEFVGMKNARKVAGRSRRSRPTGRRSGASPGPRRPLSESGWSGPPTIGQASLIRCYRLLLRQGINTATVSWTEATFHATYLTFFVAASRQPAMLGLEPAGRGGTEPMNRPGFDGGMRRDEPANASAPPLRAPPHGSGPPRLATPSV
jgi:hypothetical protein